MAISPAEIDQWHLTRALPTDYEKNLNEFLRTNARKSDGLWFVEVSREKLEHIICKDGVSNLDMLSLMERYQSKNWIISYKSNYYLFKALPNDPK